MGDVETPTGAWTFGCFFFLIVALIMLANGLQRPSSLAAWLIMAVCIALGLFFGRMAIKIKKRNAGLVKRSE